MTGSLAFDTVSSADTVTKTTVALLSLFAVGLITVGLLRALLGRRRPQIVISDIEGRKGVPASAVASLSPQLRQAVRRALVTLTPDASYSHLNTLAADERRGLLTTAGSTEFRVVDSELQAETQDVVATLSSGVRALAPKEADGLLAALSACLPAQRGCAVRTIPMLRKVAERVELGLTLEFAAFRHAPDAVATFWSPVSTTGDPTGVGSTLTVLLVPAGQWIAIRLAAGYLAATERRRVRFESHGHRRTELHGLRLQLAGQMSLYASRRLELFAPGFAQQALDDLAEASRLLPGYFRPDYTQAEVYERVGWSYRKAGSTQLARDAFIEAIGAYDRAAATLFAAIDRFPSEAGDDLLQRLRLRRTKCRLLSNDPEQCTRARSELRALAEPSSVDPRSLYNAACLYAVAVGSRVGSSSEALMWKGSAWQLLGRSLLIRGDEGPWALARTDVELEDLDNDIRLKFYEQLAIRNPGSAGLDDAEARTRVRQAMDAVPIAR